MKTVFVASVAASMALASFSASAQFMKPGASPESGFAGVWRVVGAKAAPWAPKASTSATRYPLLEYAIDFAAGEVKGPAPVACKGATFSSGVSAADELFGGQLRHSEAAAKALNLTGSSVTTYRVICEGKPRDYYVDDNAALVTWQDDVVYTLERPTGMDPQQYTPGFSGPAFDCAKAKTAGEQMICRDAALSKADRKLNEAFSRLKATETPASFDTVRVAQRDWIAYVTRSCHAGGSMPDDVGDRDAMQGCLEEHFSDRARTSRECRGRQSRRAGPRATHAPDDTQEARNRGKRHLSLDERRPRSDGIQRIRVCNSCPRQTPDGRQGPVPVRRGCRRHEALRTCARIPSRVSMRTS